LIPFKESLAQNKEGSVFIIDGQRYSVKSQSGSLKINGAPVSIGGEITINGEILTIGSDAIKIGGATIPLEKATEPTAAANAKIMPSVEKTGTFKDGVGLLIGDATLTPGQVTTMSGTVISVASDGAVVVATSTAASREMDISTEDAGGIVTIDGTVYSASTIAGQSLAILLAGQTLSIGGSAATIHGQVITKGSSGISIVESISSVPDSTSKPDPSPDTTRSSTLQQTPATPSEESYAPKHSHGFGLTLLSMAMLIATFVNF
jgi:uncharacterized Zn-binding protein involved in type VI secretion